MKLLSFIFALLLSVAWTLPSVAGLCEGCASGKMTVGCQEKTHQDEEEIQTFTKMDCHKAKPKVACEGKKKKDEDNQSTINTEPKLACEGCCCLTQAPVAQASFDEALPEFHDTKASVFFVVLSVVTLDLPRIYPNHLLIKSPPDLKRESAEILTFKQSFLI
jgi:hypothetical protein